MNALPQISVATGLAVVDPSDILPPEAQEKLAILQAEALDANDRVSNRAKTGAPMGDAPAVAGALKFLLVGIDDFLSRAARQGAKLKMLPPVHLPADASLEGVRDEISALSRVVASLIAQPPTKSEVEQRIRAGAAALEGEGRPAPLQLRRETFNFADAAQGVRSAFGGKADPLAYMAWLFGADALADRLIADIPDDIEGALPKFEREAKVGQLRGQILHLERQEEAIVLREAEEGRIVVRRAEAGPNALLGVTG